MIRETKVITQDYNKDLGRASWSKVVFKRYLFGIKIFSYSECFKESQKSDKDTQIGFKK